MDTNKAWTLNNLRPYDGGGSYSWDSGSSTLTLNNFRWETEASAAMYIEFGDRLNLKLTGDNAFISRYDYAPYEVFKEKEYVYSYGMHVFTANSAGAFTIEGAGSLTVCGGAVDPNLNYSSPPFTFFSRRYAMNVVSGYLNVNNIRLTATNTGSDKFKPSSYSIEGTAISATAQLNINNTDVNIGPNGAGISIIGDLNIANSTVNVHASRRYGLNAYTSNAPDGKPIPIGFINIKNSAVSILIDRGKGLASDKSISVTNSSVDIDSVDGDGIETSGTISVAGSSIAVKTGDNRDSSEICDGIQASSITALDSTVSVNCTNPGAFGIETPSGIKVNNGTIISRIIPWIRPVGVAHGALHGGSISAVSAYYWWSNTDWQYEPTGSGTLSSDSPYVIDKNDMFVKITTDGVKQSDDVTVYYDSHDADGRSVPFTVHKGTVVTAQDPEKLGFDTITFTFLGWNTSPDQKGETIAVDQQFVVNSNVILYAMWAIRSTVTPTPTATPTPTPSATPTPTPSATPTPNPSQRPGTLPAEGDGIIKIARGELPASLESLYIDGRLLPGMSVFKSEPTGTSGEIYSIDGSDYIIIAGLQVGKTYRIVFYGAGGSGTFDKKLTAVSS